MVGKKRAKQFFLKQTNSATKKVGKKIVGKKFQKAFFIFARISYQKNGWKKPAKQFFLKHTNSAPKKVGEKIVGKKCERAFFIFAQFSVTKIWEEKTWQTIVPETHE